MNASDAAALLVDRVRARPWGLATVVIAGDDTAFGTESGHDPVDEDSLFQIGSITKTMTAFLFADAVSRGKTKANVPLRDVLGVKGAASEVTLEELATHHSGLPRLPANLAGAQDPRDPYAGYTRDDLLAALESTELGAKEQLYSNFGFMTLGLALTALTGRSFDELMSDRLLAPLGMSRTGCPGPVDGRVPGYSGGQHTPWWTTQTPGAGGVGASIRDIGSYLRALVDPAGPVGDAINLATVIHAEDPPPIGYAWFHVGGGWWHNGATYGFRSFAAFHRPTRTAVGLLANTGDDVGLDKIGFATLTEMVRGGAT